MKNKLLTIMLSLSLLVFMLAFLALIYGDTLDK